MNANAASDQLLFDFWYVACASSALKAGRVKRVMLLGAPVALARGADGRAFALRDACPHRGMPLSYGRVRGDTVECCYHGWRFGADGVCAHIPALVDGQNVDVAAIRAGAYAVAEKHGLIWVYVTADARPVARAEIGEPPDAAPGFPADARPNVVMSFDLPCNHENAVYGLMDLSHITFVHNSRWWVRNPEAMTAKERRFEPTELGWACERHRVAPYKLGYRLLGREVWSQISYRLPGIRLEHVQGDRHQFVSFTMITPVNERETVLHQVNYWDAPIGTLLKPLLWHFTRVFLRQDQDVITKQAQGLPWIRRTMLMPDADAQGVWWLRLKKAWEDARAENRPFVNPLRKATLRWRS